LLHQPLILQEKPLCTQAASSIPSLLKQKIYRGAWKLLVKGSVKFHDRKRRNAENS
jgi:hypothetical protein